MADSTWLILRQQGVIVEEADEDEGNEGSLGTEDVFDEKDACAEKVALDLQDIGIGGRLVMIVGSGKKFGRDDQRRIHIR